MLLSCLQSFSQSSANQFRVWRLIGFNGEVKVRGTYRDFELYRNNSSLTSQQDYYFNGLLHLNTKSYILHPNFMLLSLSGTFNPVTRKDKYIGIPDYSENYRTQGFDATALMLSKKQVNITGNATVSNTIQNVESLTHVETNNKQYGVGLTYRNNVFPISLALSKQNIDQLDLNTGKKFNFQQKLFQASGSGSISKYDSHYISYLHTNNNGSDNVSIFNSQPFGTVNNVDQIELNDEIVFDSLKRYSFTSSIMQTIERGSVYYSRLYARENLMLRLPKQLTFNANYNLGASELDSNKVSYQGIQTSLSHKLYESLVSKIFYEHNETRQATYDDDRNKYGMELNYTKKIPTGKLSLGYSYFREYQKVKSPPTLFRVFRESKLLDDFQITTLNNSNVDLSTVVVRDVTGAIIYHITLDYLLIQTGSYVEIVRVPGGMIANNTTVYIDYDCTRPGAYGYFMDNYTFNADLLLFGSKLNLYYRTGSQNYTIQQTADNLALNYFNRYNLGVRLDFYFVKGGVEYEYYYSTILPHKSVIYFIEFQQTYKKFSFNLNANMQTIRMTSEQTNRQDIDISTKLAYYIFKRTKLDLDYMYRNIQGRGINLELTTARLELTTELHRLLLSLGAEFYQNKESDSRLRFKGVYVQLTRNF